MEQRQRKFPTLLLALTILVGAFLRFYTIGSKTLWLDEAFSVWVAHHALVDSWSWLIRIDQHPPLYYSLLHFWQAGFGDGQGAVRAFSALCSTLAMPFFYGAGRRWFTERTALIATFILAISPFHIRYAQETRMYALLSLAVAAAFYFLACLLFDKPTPNRWRSWLGLAVAQAAAMLTHNTATIFFPLALNLGIGGALFWKYRRGVSSLPALNEGGFAKRWLLGQALALLLWLPWLVPFILQARKVDQEFWIQPPTPGAVYGVLHSFNFAFLPDQLPLASLLNLGDRLLAGLGVYTLRRTPARAVILLVLCLMPFVGELLVSLRRPIFYERTLIWASLPYYMLLAAGIHQLGEWMGDKAHSPTQTMACLHWPAATRWARFMQPSIIVLVSALSLLSLTNYYFYFQKEEWDKAAAYVAQQVAPGDVILFNATWVQIPFEYYFRHYDTGAVLHGLPVDLFDRGVLEPKMAETDVATMHKLLAGRSRVWLVYSHDRYTDPHKIIPRELGRMMPQQASHSFAGLQVIRYA